MTTPRTRSRSQARRRSFAWRGFLEPLEHRAVPAVFSVTTALDNGSNSSPTPGSLRAAIVSLNTSPDPTNSIEFDIPGSGVQTIRPLSSLPPITRPVVLDGTTQSPTPTTLPQIELDGTDAGPAVHGLEFSLGSDNSVVRGLIINRFQTDYYSYGNGIQISGGSGHLIQGNYIGTDASGTLGLGNQRSGIYIGVGVSHVSIGGTTEASRNLISANLRFGIDLAGSACLIQGNYIGTDVSGSLPLGNLRSGIAGLETASFSASDITIGGTGLGARNIISANGSGITSDSDDRWLIQGNYIGIDASGIRPLGNGVGIDLRGAGSTIGGTDPGAGNIISASDLTGVSIRDSVSVVIQGNYIGTDATGTLPLGNGQSGIYVGRSSTIGGIVAGARNVISANKHHGILVGGDDCLIQGNYIGTNAAGTESLGNFIDGIVDNNVSGTTIGGTTPEARNLLSGQIGAGIVLAGHSSLVQGNYIGTDASGTRALGNGRMGILTLNSTNATIGGTDAGAGNLISGNTGDGIRIEGASSTNSLIQGNYVGTDATGMLALGNATSGISVEIGASHVTVGGTAEGARNVISANGRMGINFLGTNCLVQGNYIGTDVTGTQPLGNALYGVFGQGTLSSSPSDITIGGTDLTARNVLSANHGGIASGTGERRATAL